MNKDQSMRAFMDKAPLSAKVKIFCVGFAAVIVFLASTGSIAFILKAHLAGRPQQEAGLGPARHVDSIDPEYTHTFEIKDMSMAVLSKNGLRTAYAQFTLLFDCPTEATKELMGMERAKILDSIYEAGSTLTIEEFGNPEGFAKFKNSTMELLKKHFPQNPPRQVALKNWFMQ